MGHAESFVHAWSDGIDRSGAADFVVKFGREFFGASNDASTFFTIWVPSVFSFGAGFLAEGGEGDLRETIFNNFVAWGEFVFFPVASFASGLLQSGGDFGNLVVCEWIIVDLLPVVFCGVVAVILGALRHE